MEDNNLRNRIWNSSNPHQGRWKRTLCVCSAGLLRSPTLAWVLGNEPYYRNTRAAGSEPTFALIPVDPVLLEWAEEIVFVSPRNKESFDRQGFVTHKEVYVLNIPDAYEYRHPMLVDFIKRELKSVGFPISSMGVLVPQEPDRSQGG